MGAELGGLTWPFADSLVAGTEWLFEPFVQLSVAVDFLHIGVMEQRSSKAEEILEAVRPRDSRDVGRLTSLRMRRLVPGPAGKIGEHWHAGHTNQQCGSLQRRNLRDA